MQESRRSRSPVRITGRTPDNFGAMMSQLFDTSLTIPARIREKPSEEGGSSANQLFECSIGQWQLERQIARAS